MSDPIRASDRIFLTGLTGLVGSAVIRGCQTAVRAGNLDVQLRIADFLTDHLQHSFGTEYRVGNNKRNFAAGCHAGRYARAVLLRDTYIIVLGGKFFPECLCLTGLTDIDSNDTYILIGFSKSNDLITKTFSGRFLLIAHSILHFLN